MLFSVTGSIGTITHMIILYILYRSKIRFNHYRTKLFQLILGILFVLTILEIVAAVLLDNTQYYEVADLIMKIHWYGVMPLFFVTYYYYVLYLLNLNVNSFKELINYNIVMKISTFISVILFIIAFFVPIHLRDDISYIFIPGFYGYYLIGFIGTLLIWIIVYSLMNKGKTRVEKSIIVGFAIIFSLFSVFQILVLHVSFYAATFTAIMYFLYATSENPDLEIIDNLKVLTEENKKSSATKTDIILNISHDAMTPMNAISNYCSNLLTLKDGSQIDNNANNIINASKDLLNIVDDILEMFGEDKVISNDVYNIYDLCEGLKGVTQSRVDKKPIKIIFKIDEKIPLLRGNAIKMYRILVNVLSNAVNNTEVGKIIMNIRGEKINHDDIILHISIFDSGCGIKDEDKNKVFKYAVDGSHIEIVNTKKNIDFLGGKIWFDSLYDSGTTYYIDIPQKIHSTGISNDNINEENRVLLNCSKCNALIVDGNESNIKVMSRLLERYNFKVDSCYDGKSCVDKIKSGNKYDIIFTDLSVDKVNEEDILKVLKYLNKVYDMPPVVALSTNVLNNVRETCLKRGFDEYIAKPIDIKQLDRIINLFFKP